MRRKGPSKNTSRSNSRGKKASANEEEKRGTPKRSSSSAYKGSKPRKAYDKSYGNKNPRFKKTQTTSSEAINENADGSVRLNKYMANAGICSRREADELIAAGVVQVNGKVVTEMGYKVGPNDSVNYGGETLQRERLVYLVMNKPKDYITTADDPKDRRTVFAIIKNACKERVYPVGRLDRNTTGVLMFTNDGELTKRLTHPSYGVRKIYHVELDKAFTAADMKATAEGLVLDDGPIKVDAVSYVANGADKKQVGVELHSGRNRIVRRIFESQGYKVKKLDRVMFGTLTKKDLPRGRYRILSETEVNLLRMSSSKRKKTH